MAINQDDKKSDSNSLSKTNVLLDVLGCSYRATVRLFRGLPASISNYVKRKVKEYRNRPKRTDISRVYVVVGYTNKKRVDEKFNAERRMMIIRRGLLILIFVLIVFIAVDRVTGYVNYGELSQIFGIDSFDAAVENDPFAGKGTLSTSYSVADTTETTSH